jgi:hypothetical protein
VGARKIIGGGQICGGGKGTEADVNVRRGGSDGCDGWSLIIGGGQMIMRRRPATERRSERFRFQMVVMGLMDDGVR